MIDSQRLAYFATVAQTSSIRRAAELLHITPAALSRAMKVLEQEVGFQLLATRGRGIVLTDAGRELARRARPVLTELASLHDLAPERREGVALLRYASHETFGTYFASELVAATSRSIEIEHRYLVPGAIEQALLDQVVDVGVAYISHPLAGTTAIAAGQLVMAVFGLEHFRTVPFDEYRYALPAGPVVDSPIAAQALDGWPAPSIARDARFRVTHTETALEHCRMGRCVAYFPEFLVELHNRRAAPNRRLVRLPAPPPVDGHLQPVYITVRDGEASAPAATGMLAAVARIAV